MTMGQGSDSKRIVTVQEEDEGDWAIRGMNTRYKRRVILSFILHKTYSFACVSTVPVVAHLEPNFIKYDVPQLPRKLSTCTLLY